MAEPLTLRDAVKKGRKRLGVTQDGLADLVNCSRSLVASIEGGTHPTSEMLRKLADAFDEADRSALLATAEARRIMAEAGIELAPADGGDDVDMINLFMKLRRSGDVDLSGTWNAIWLTTVHGEENRNREVIDVRRRLNGTWELSNREISAENPEGGYLWVAKVELFDNRHMLGYYCARDRAVLAKGTLCLELQPNGREIVGVWDGLNFDTMWASGIVALTRATGNHDPADSMERFIRKRPKMPYK